MDVPISKHLTLSLKIDLNGIPSEFICETRCNCQDLLTEDCDCTENLLDAIYSMEQDTYARVNDGEPHPTKLYGAIISQDVFEQHLEYKLTDKDMIN